VHACCPNVAKLLIIQQIIVVKKMKMKNKVLKLDAKEIINKYRVVETCAYNNNNNNNKVWKNKIPSPNTPPPPFNCLLTHAVWKFIIECPFKPKVY
jgi:hypothetical protein